MRCILEATSGAPNQSNFTPVQAAAELQSKVPIALASINPEHEALRFRLYEYATGVSVSPAYFPFSPKTALRHSHSRHSLAILCKFLRPLEARHIPTGHFEEATFALYKGTVCMQLLLFPFGPGDKSHPPLPTELRPTGTRLAVMGRRVDGFRFMLFPPTSLKEVRVCFVVPDGLIRGGCV